MPPYGQEVSAMLITMLAMQSLWMILQEHQQRRLARKNHATFAPRAATSGAVDPDAPFWPAVLARYRKQIRLADARRDRTRRAIARWSRTSARKVRPGSRG
jgi:hypothetical protein